MGKKGSNIAGMTFGDIFHFLLLLLNVVTDKHLFINNLLLAGTDGQALLTANPGVDRAQRTFAACHSPNSLHVSWSQTELRAKHVLALHSDYIQVCYKIFINAERIAVRRSFTLFHLAGFSSGPLTEMHFFLSLV